MNEDTREIEAALGSLRPRRLPDGLSSRLSAAVAAEIPRARPRIISFVAWSSAAVAACLALFLAIPSESPAPEPMAMAALADAAPPMVHSSAPPMARSSAPMTARSLNAEKAAAPPDFRLVRAEQAPAEVTLLEPVRVTEGLFARPVQVRWHNAAHYRDSRGGAEFVRFAPHDEVIGLVPFETD
jgi:hypothetical protein